MENIYMKSPQGGRKSFCSLALVTLMTVFTAFGQTFEYQKVTESPDSWAGTYVLADATAGGPICMLDGIHDSNYGTIAAVTAGGGAIASTGKTDSCRITVAAAGDGYYTMELEGAGYLGFEGTKNKLYAYEAYISEKCDWSITMDADGGLTVSPAHTSPSRILRYNESSPRFACYKSGQSPIALYRYTQVSSTPAVAAPAFAPPAGLLLSPADITITCETENASIYYTTDGSVPTGESALYESPIHVESTTTIKAVAYAEGYEASRVTAAEYQFPVEVPDIASFKAAAEEDVVYRITGDLTYVDRIANNIFVTDATGALLIYDSYDPVVTTAYQSGDIIPGGVCGKYFSYNGLKELKPCMDMAAAIGNNGAVEPVEVTAGDLLADFASYESRLVRVSPVHFSSAAVNAQSRNAVFTQNGHTMKLYNSFKTVDMEIAEGQAAAVTAFVGCYRGTAQLNPRGNGDIVLLAAAEDFDRPAGGWTLVNGTQANQWHVGQAPGFDNGKLYVSGTGGASNKYVIYNAKSEVHAYMDVEVPAAGLTVAFDVRVAGEGRYDNLSVSVVDTTVTPVAGQDVAAGTPYLSGLAGWTRHTVTVPGGDTTAVKRIVLTWKNDNSGGTQPAAAVDNIVMTAGICADVASAEVTGITANSAKITREATEDVWKVVYAAENGSALSLTMDGEELDLAGLLPNTGYTVHIYNVCGGAVSAGPYTLHFTTEALCAAPEVQVPKMGSGVKASWTGGEGSCTACLRKAGTEEWMTVYEGEAGFITLSALEPNTAYDFRVRAACDETQNSTWTEVSFTTGCAAVDVPYKQEFSGYAAPECWEAEGWQFNGSSAVAGGGDEACLISPYMAIPATGRTVISYDAAGAEEPAIALSTESTALADFRVQLAPEDGRVTIPAVCNGHKVYILFRGAAGLTLDNVTVSACGCNPAGLAADNIKYDRATLTWTVDYEAQEYEVAFTDLTTGEVRTLPAYGPVCRLTGLTEQTSYRVVVTAVCGGHRGYPSEPYTFTTAEQCPAPAGLTADVAEDNSVNLAWTAPETPTGWSLQYCIAGTGLWSAEIHADTNTYMLTGLESNMPYTLRLKADCEGSAAGSAYATVSFKTNCITPGPDITATTGEGTGEQNYFMPGYYGYQYSGNLYEMENYGTISSIGFDISVAGSASGSTMEIWLRQVPASFSLESSMTFASLKEGAVQVYSGQPDLSSAGRIMFDIEGGFTVDRGNRLLVLTRGAAASPTGSGQVKVHCSSVPNSIWIKRQDHNDPGEDVAGSLGDDLPNMQYSVSLCGDVPACAVPAVTVDGVTVTTAEVSWTGNGVSYVLKYKAEGDAGYKEVAGIADTHYTLTGLIPGEVSYSVKVAAVCSETATSTYSEPVVFTTACYPVDIPYTENFDSYEGAVTSDAKHNNLPACWSHVNTGRDQAGCPLIYGSSYNAFSGANALLFYIPASSYYYDYDNSDQYAVMPPVDIAAHPLSTLQLSFMAKKYSDCAGDIIIGVMSDPADAATFVPVDTVAAGAAGYEYRQVYFDSYDGGGAYIAVRAAKDETAGVGFNIDDITLDFAPTCSQPEVTEYNPISNTLVWTDGRLGTPVSYNIECADGNGNVHTYESDTKHIAVSSLSLNTEYTARVRAVCGEDDNSEWSEPFVFTTPLSGCVAPADVTGTLHEDASVTVTWNAAEGQEKWALQYKEDKSPVWSADIIVEGSPAYTFTGLQTNTAYQVKVRSVCAEGMESEETEGAFIIPCQTSGELETVTVGSGSGETYRLPFDAYYKNSWTQMIYPADMVGTGGNIETVSFNCIKNTGYSGDVNEAVLENVRVYMGHTGMTAHTAKTDWVPLNSLKLVYSADELTIGAETGWQEIVLDNAFAYNGTDNLVVVVAKTIDGYNSNVKFETTPVDGISLACESDNDPSCAQYPEGKAGKIFDYMANAAFSIVSCGDSVFCKAAVNGLEADDITTGSAHLVWNSSDAATYVVECNGAQIITTDTFADLDGLSEYTEYTATVYPMCGSHVGKTAAVTFTTESSSDIVVMGGGVTRLTTCNAYIYDNGGADGNYNSNSDDVLTILPAEEGMGLHISGNYNGESGWSYDYDYIDVYEGETAGGTLLHHFSGQGYADFVTGGPVTLRFVSDGSTNHSGFEFKVECEEPMPTYTMGADTAVTTCRAVIVDNGGAAGQYGSSSDDVMTIYAETPEEGIALVHLTGQYDIESNYDHLIIYDGPSTDAPMVGDYSGTGGGAVDVVSTSNSLTLHFTSDGSSQYEGFALHVSCEIVTCAVPGGLQVGGITAGSASISFVPVTAETAWVMQYKKDGQSWDEAQTADITGSPAYDIVGLDENTGYAVRIKASCGEGDFSGWSEEVPFRTKAGASIVLDDVVLFDACDLGAADVTFSLTNAGGIALEAFTATYSVNGGEVVTETFECGLPAGESQLFTFAVPARFEGDGNTITVTVSAENETEELLADNTVVVTGLDVIAPMLYPYPTLPVAGNTVNEGGWVAYNGNHDMIDDGSENTWSIAGGSAVCGYNDTMAVNDWLITPCYELPAGRYRVSFDYRAAAAVSESLSLHYGAGNRIADMTGIVCRVNSFENTDYATASAVIEIAADGVYNFGFHAVSAPGAMGMTVAGLNVTPMVNVTSLSDGNGAIAPAGTMELPVGAVQYYVINPEPGYGLLSLTVDGKSSGIGPSASGSIVYVHHVGSADEEIKAVFGSLPVIRYTVTAGSCYINNVLYGSDDTVAYAPGIGEDFFTTFAPAPGYRISSVTVNGVEYGGITAWAFENVIEDQYVVIGIEPNVYTVVTQAYGNGTVSAGAVFSYDPANTYVFTATPDEGYHIVSVVRNSVPLSVADPEGTFADTLSDIVSDYGYRVRFAPSYYTITAVAGPGGRIEPAGATAFRYGSSAEYTVTAAAGFHIASVTVDGETTAYTQADAVNSTSVVFDDIRTGHTVEAAFARYEYEITVTSGENGTVAPGTATYAYGASPLFVITPDEGYGVADVLVDGVSVGAVTSYRFAALTAGHTIEAVFAEHTYTITATAGQGGTVTPAGVTEVGYDGTQTYAIEAEAGYSIAAVFVDGMPAGPVGSYTFSNVRADHTLAASFARNRYTVTVVQPDNGFITPGTMAVDYGATPAFVIAPAAGYSVASVTLGGSDVTADASVQNGVYTYTLPAVTADVILTAAMRQKTYTITATSGANGTVTPAGEATVGHGASKTYTFTPDEGYEVSSVTVDGIRIGTPAAYTFVNVAADHTVDVEFAAEECTAPENLYTSGIGEETAVFNWYHPEAQSFSVKYKAVNAATFTMVDDIGETRLEVTDLEPGTSYVWSVKAGCGGNNESVWAGFCSFMTKRGPATGVDGYADGVKVYSSAAEIHIVNAGNVRIDAIQVYDIYGRLVYEGRSNANPEVISLNVATGTYVVRLATESGLNNYKLHLGR